jgi:alkylated DNA repair dioxygenase AlkB
MKIDGLTLQKDFITKEQEINLLKFINQQPWNITLERRTQHYAYNYSYCHKGHVSKTKPIPEEFKVIFSSVFPVDELTQILVNEYTPGQGIGKHIDDLMFDDTVMSLSLGSDIAMKLAKDKEEYNIYLPRRSLLTLSGDARYKWTHAIEKKKIDDKRMINVCTGNYMTTFITKRGTRVSITIRKLKKSVKINEENENESSDSGTDNEEDNIIQCIL